LIVGTGIKYRQKEVSSDEKGTTDRLLCMDRSYIIVPVGIEVGSSGYRLTAPVITANGVA
jgi:hypothetical protein